MSANVRERLTIVDSGVGMRVSVPVCVCVCTHVCAPQENETN